MNNFDNELQALFDEIDRLKKENQELKDKVLAMNMINNSSTSLEEFLTNKYLVLHNAILQSKLKETENKIKAYEINKRELVDSNISIETILAKDEEYEKKNDELLKENDAINRHILELNKKKESIIDFYTSRLRDLELPIISRYNSLIQNLNKDYIAVELNKYVADLESSYPISIEAKKLYKRMNDEIEQIENEKLHYLEKKDELDSKQDNLVNSARQSFETYINKMMEHYDSTIELEEKLKEEIANEFERIKETNLKNILSQINYYKLLEVKNQDISERIEKLIDHLINQLSLDETMDNLKMNKKVRLNEINIELERLAPDYKALQKLKDIENHYYEIYISSSNAIDELVDYLDNASLAISECEKYSEVVKKYLDLKKKEVDYKQHYDKLNKDFNQIEKERQEKSLCAFPDDEIRELTTELAKINSERFKLTGKMEDVKYEIDKIEKSYSNLQLLTVLKEKAYVEEKLPIMYNNLRNLKLKISDYKYSEAELEKKLKNYKKLVIEKERLEDELQDK